MAIFTTVSFDQVKWYKQVEYNRTIQEYFRTHQLCPRPYKLPIERPKIERNSDPLDPLNWIK